MEVRSPDRRTSEHRDSRGQLLATRYAQLMRWALVLARNDHAKAEEIVQEFCLYVTVAKPDFSHVSNLDGYLYTCLRHIYTSSMAKASRDALRLVSLEDYDSFAMAISSHTSGDALHRQNDLRRTCAYTVWRKESSKTASYFILHFFHGYERQEIADIARVTMATIYNKLKTARSEVGIYLRDAGKIKVIGQNDPPAPNLRWHVVPVFELFAELRETILRAKSTSCLPEHELRALYSSPGQTPVPCELLAHIVSCERCLDIVDRIGQRPTLKDREPLDVFGYSPREGGEQRPANGGMTYDRMMDVVQREWKRVHDHRPGRLSIALNGEVIASHDVRSDHNRLTVRIEAMGREKFVEVFSEQDVRLALLPVEGILEPATPQRLRVHLSDARVLELSVSVDGLGLESDVVYTDPVLSEPYEEEEDHAVVTAESMPVSTPLETIRQWLRLLAQPAMAWALALLVAVGLGSWIYSRHQAPLRASAVLEHAFQVETAALRGQTEHQVVRVEEVSSDGKTRIAGIVDTWKDGDGARSIRRLYNDQGQLLAAEWRAIGQSVEKKRGIPPDGLVGQFWDQELSASAFATMDDDKPAVRTTTVGYEITKMGASQKYPQLISATLVLNGKYEAIEQRLRVRAANGVEELRFIQVSYELTPSHAVPDKTFEADSANGRRGRPLPGPRGLVADDGVRLAELEISTLYALRYLNADTGIPIEVTRTPSGRVRVEGVVADETLRRQIGVRLRELADASLLDVRIAAAGHVQARARGSIRPGHIEAYEVGQTRFAGDEPVRRFFEDSGLTGDALNQAVDKYSLDALAHAQRALQHAYALNRLGSAVSGDELRSIDEPSQRRWTEMVDAHARGVRGELRALRDQLAGPWPHASEELKAQESAIEIANSSQYAQAAQRLLEQVSALNQHMGELFTANGRPDGAVNQEGLIRTIMGTGALNESSAITEFATRLSESADGKRTAAAHE
jgi:DNA-directed RNA polymerase specialized sigma24 family protein